MEALDLTLTTTYFQYDNHFYKQIFGLAMGAPISSVIAQLVLEDAEEHILSHLNLNLNF